MTFASLVDLSAGREARVTVEAICTTRIVNGVPRVAATEFLVSTSGLEQSRAMIEVELQRALHFSAMAGSLGEVASITAELVTD